MIGILPTELAISVPVESIDPSPCSAAATNRMIALSIFRPPASRASAVNRTVSPAVISRVVGVTMMRAIGDSGTFWGGGLLRLLDAQQAARAGEAATWYGARVGGCDTAARPTSGGATVCQWPRTIHFAQSRTVDVWSSD